MLCPILGAHCRVHRYGDLQRVLQTCKTKEVELTPGEQAGLLTQVRVCLDVPSLSA